MKKALRLFSLLVILEIIIFLFLKLSFFPEILLTNLAFIIILIYFLILLSFLFFFLSTFFENEFSKRIINLFLGKNKVFLLFSYAIIGILLLASLIILIIKDLLIKDFQEILIPLSILGFFLFWEILIFLSFSNLKTRNKRKYWIGLPILISINYFYWAELVEINNFLEPYLSKAYSQEAKIIFSKYQWWQLLLPIEELRGFWQYIIILTHYMENVIGISGVWHFNQLVLLFISFYLSWDVFHSEIFSYFLSISLVLGTHFYHAFQYSSIAGFYLLHSLFLVLLYFGYKYIYKEKKESVFLIVTIPLIIFTSTLMEGWLDFFGSVWMTLILLVVLFRKKKMPKRSRKTIHLLIVYSLIAGIYTLLKFTYIGFPHNTGESAVVFSYGVENIWRMVEDSFSNYIAQLYLTITNFLPPNFLISNALYENQTNTFTKNPLIFNHYLFIWRYSAGILFAVFFYYLVKVIKLIFQEDDYLKYLPLAIFLIMVMVNSPTHTIVQIRGFKTLPLLGYQVQQGVLGISLTYAYLMHLAKIRVKNEKLIIIMSFVVFFILFYTSIHKPNYLWYMIRLAGLDQQGQYPLPINNMINLIRKFINLFSINSL